MKYRFGRLFLAVLISGLCSMDSFSVDLVGAVNISQTSSTAAKAKTEAMEAARRRIIFDVLSNYSEIEPLSKLMEKTSDDDLVGFVSATTVSNEQISSETYSATITMNIDNDVVKRWLTLNEVRNWIPVTETTEKFSVFVVVPNGISDWAELKRIAGNDNVEIETITIIGNQIFAKLPLNYRSKFTAALRNAGWKYADNSGVLQVWR